MYKNKEKQREYNKERMRVTRTGNTKAGNTGQGMTLLKRPNRMGADGPEMVENDYNPDEMWQCQPRYVGPFTDGQVLDRTTVPNLPVGGFTPGVRV